jgi:hypothetical protein
MAGGLPVPVICRHNENHVMGRIFNRGEPMAQTVFLIHDQKDKPFARQLAVSFSLAGATVWLDEGEIGDSRNSLIEDVFKAIADHVHLAVILSPHSSGSESLKHKLAFLLKQQTSGFTITVLPMLIQDCAIPTFMAGKRMADFRNPEGFPIMLKKVMAFLGLGTSGNGPLLPPDLAGIWQGDWVWCGRQRHAEMNLSSWPQIPSRMIIRYQKSGVLTLVEEELDVERTENGVKLIGTRYRLLEHGISSGWILDSISLSMGKSGLTLEGIFTDKKGVQTPLLFKRQ